MAETRRIAFFLPSLRGGGAERAMLDLARGFARRGAQVDMLLAQAEGAYLTQIPPGIRLLDLQAARILACLRPLAAYLRSARPQALLSTQVHANLTAIWAKRLARVPTRVVIREATTGSHPVYRAGSFLRFHLFKALARAFYPWADRIVAVSNGVAADMGRNLALPTERIRVIYNAICQAELEELARQPAPHPWFAAPEAPIVLSAGRLSPEKDFPTLLRAFARLPDRTPARLVILGEGKERGGLSRLIGQLGVGDRVDMPGFVVNPFAYMARSAVYVLSSVCEGMPNALVQAALLGIPFVATDCPSGPAEIVGTAGGGRLVPVGDEARLAAAIGEVLTRGGEGARRENLLRVFSDTAVLDAYGDLLFSGEAYA